MHPNSKNKIWGGVLVVIALVIIILLVVLNKPVDIPGDTTVTPENIQAETGYESLLFRGELEEVNNSCAFDVQCSVTVAGKVIETSPGMVTEEYREEMGIMKGSGDISDINALEGEGKLKEKEAFVFEPTEKITVEALVRVHDDGKLSIYGSNDYYIRIIK